MAKRGDQQAVGGKVVYSRLGVPGHSCRPRIWLQPSWAKVQLGQPTSSKEVRKYLPFLATLLREQVLDSIIVWQTSRGTYIWAHPELLLSTYCIPYYSNINFLRITACSPCAIKYLTTYWVNLWSIFACVSIILTNT